MMALYGMAVGDLRDVARKLKTRDARRFWKVVCRKLGWLRKELECDLKLGLKDFVGVR